jgi:hypothetical protein
MVPVTGKSIVFGPVNVTAGTILHLMQAVSLLPVQAAVGDRPVMKTVDPTLLPVQTPVFISRNLAVADAGAYAPCLSIFPHVVTTFVHALALFLYHFPRPFAGSLAGPGCRSPYQCQE